MADPPKTILLCSCEDTMQLDTSAVRRVCRNSEIANFRHLCRAELDQFRNAARTDGSLMVGCAQESPLLGRPDGFGPQAGLFLLFLFLFSFLISNPIQTMFKF